MEEIVVVWEAWEAWEIWKEAWAAVIADIVSLCKVSVALVC